jgi:hypothetical protein
LLIIVILMYRKQTQKHQTMTTTKTQKTLNVCELIDLAKNKNIKGVIHKEVDSCHTILDIKP